MKAISVTQPYASFIAEGKKTIETRPEPTDYRGDILVVASKTAVATSGLPLGQALCIANLVDCRPLRKEDEPATKVSFFPGMYAWVLSDVRPIEPFPVQGKTGLYEAYFDSVGTQPTTAYS